MKTKLKHPEPPKHTQAPSPASEPLVLPPPAMPAAESAPDPTREPLYWAIVAEDQGPMTIWDCADDMARFERVRRGEKDPSVLREVGDDPIAFFFRPESEARQTRGLWVFSSKDAALFVAKERHSLGKDAATKVLARKQQMADRRADEERQREAVAAQSLEQRTRALFATEIKAKRQEAARHLALYERAKAEADTLEGSLEARVRTHVAKASKKSIVKDEVKRMLENRANEPKVPGDGLLVNAIENMASKFSV